MGELARGSVTDRPWGRTFAALGLRGLTGQLTVTSDGKRYPVAFSRGAVVAAHSPLAGDSGVRIAMTGGLISSTQVADIVRRQQASPNRDEVELIADLIRLGPDQALRLRRRMIAQRAARTFSLDRGDFIVDDRIALDVVPGCDLDIRAIVYLGARYNVAEQRLADEVDQFGSWFKIKQDAVIDIPQFGFADDERHVLELLFEGAAMQELELSSPDVDMRMVRAVIYSLVACNACDAEGAVAPAPAKAPVARGIPQAAPRAPLTGQATARATPPPMQPPVQPVQQRWQPEPELTLEDEPPRRQVASQPARPAAAPQPARAVAAQARPEPARAPDKPAFIKARTNPGGSFARADHPGMSTSPGEVLRLAPMAQAAPVKRKSPVDSQKAIAETEALIAARSRLVDDHVDHYTMLGVGQNASEKEISKAYFAIARQLHPDRLSSLGMPDEDKKAQRLFAHINTAFGVLSSPPRRAEYTAILKRGGEAAIRAEDAKAEQLANRILEAEEAFRRGELAMRRDQVAAAITEFKRAIELNPEESDYVVLLAWAQFCNTQDKPSIAQGVRRAIATAIRKSPNSVTGRFFLGRVERMLGRDQEALHHFQEVLDVEPGHPEATAEVRYLTERLGSNQRSKR